MNPSRAVLRKACAVPTSFSVESLCVSTTSLRISSRRPFHSTSCAAESKPPSATNTDANLSAVERARRTLASQQDEELKLRQQRGKLSSSSLLSIDNLAEFEDEQNDALARSSSADSPYQSRVQSNMETALNPRPNARARWQRKMVIREIRNGGRMDRETLLARTERSHTSRSHFFKTSMKKLAPLARQIAGKPIDEAILQMRFSNKKVAQDVRKHLIQARHEAIVVKGMGSHSQRLLGELDNSPVIEDPAEGPRSNLGRTPHETDIYVAQAWTNKGPYGREPEFRARGRVNTLRPPHTGLTVLLKEEKTRARETVEREEKVIKRRTGKSMWLHLPDRKVTAQRTHLLW